MGTHDFEQKDIQPCRRMPVPAHAHSLFQHRYFPTNPGPPDTEGCNIAPPSCRTTYTCRGSGVFEKTSKASESFVSGLSPCPSHLVLLSKRRPGADLQIPLRQPWLLSWPRRSRSKLQCSVAMVRKGFYGAYAWMMLGSYRLCWGFKNEWSMGPQLCKEQKMGSCLGSCLMCCGQHCCYEAS